MGITVDGREKIIVLLKLKSNPYIYKHTIPENKSIGDVWHWIFNSEYRDKDFKWTGTTFFFKNKEDQVMFMLIWS
jgi:hypothetical protein